MRILFAFTGGRGHVEPLLPLARAAAAAGHTVAFGGRPSILPAVEELGFEAHPTEPARKPPERVPLQPLDPEREARAFRDGFVLRARERAPGIEALCRDWRPDVLVGEETHYAALLAAEQLGLPFASVLVLAAGTLVTRELIGGAVNEVRTELDLPADPDATMLSKQLVLAPLPPRYRDPAFPLPAATVHYRPFERTPQRHDGTPSVYVTLGTVFNLESGDLFARVLAGVRDLPVEVVATVGDGIDPAELGELPAHIRVERFVPQAEVLTPLERRRLARRLRQRPRLARARAAAGADPDGRRPAAERRPLRSSRARARPRSGRRDPAGDRRRRLRGARGPLLSRRGAGAPGRVRRPAGAGSRGRADRGAARVSA